jgi:single-strand DNA-binding protein
MLNLNKVMLIGNLTHNPEVRYTAKGSAVADFSIALNRTFSNEAGERTEETTFVDVVAWNKSAEMAREYLSKGRKIYLEGRLQLDSWEDRQSGQMRHKLRVVAERLDFADAKPQSESDQGGSPADESNTQGGASNQTSRARDRNNNNNRTSGSRPKQNAPSQRSPQPDATIRSR